jgi:Fe-S cluster assembly iron-binding protein IscA
MTDSDNPELAEKTYNPFLTNRALSYFPDTIQFANMMNKNSHIDNMLQYSFLLNIIRKRKRFSKWFKKNDDDVLQMVIDYYGYSVNKAKEALKILNDEQIEFIREKLIKGGMK